MHVENDSNVACASCASPLQLADRFCSHCGGAVGGVGPARDPLIGAVVGDRYRILSRVGIGGMGTVYAVEHIRIGKVAALKLLHAELSRDESMVRRFTREARAVSRLSGPYTVSVFDYGRSNGLVFLVMEMLRGHDLSEELEHSGPLAPDRVARIVTMIAQSLSEAHALGIIHRDIKPQNVFLCECAGGDPERIKVLDFGLAKLTEREDSLVATHAGTILGTPYYMAPEQIEDKPLDHRCDVYSLAALTWCLLTGTPPYRHSSALGVLHQHLTSPVPQLGELIPRLAALDSVFVRGLAKSPAERFGSVEAFAGALSKALLGISASEDIAAVAARRPAPLSGATRVSAYASTQLDLGDRSELGRADLLGTRAEFDRFERGLRVQRVATVAAVGLVAAFGIAGAIRYAEGRSLFKPRDREPNDDLSLAVQIDDTMAVSGYLGAPTSQGVYDRDVYSVRVPEGLDQVLMASVTGVPGVDIVLELADGTGQYVARADGFGVGAGEAIRAARTPDRLAFFVVRPQPSTGAGANLGTPYTVRVGFRDRYEGEEAEPNATPVTAQEVIVGQSLTGLFGTSDDVDVFRIPASAGLVTASVTGISGVDLRLEQIAADESVVRVADVRRHGGSERLRIEPSGVSATYLRVSAAAPVSSELAYFLTFRSTGQPDAQPAEGSVEAAVAPVEPIDRDNAARAARRTPRNPQPESDEE